MRERRKGTIQSQRIHQQLLNPGFEIDERTFEDLLAYIVSYVEHINFYSTENIIDGNWKALIEQDPVIYIIGIIKEPIDSFKTEGKYPIEIINILLSWYVKIEQWYHTLVHFKEEVLADKIRNVLLNVLLEKKEELHRQLHKIEIENTTENSFASVLQQYAEKSSNQDFDIEETAHTFRKMVLYIQNFTRNYLNTTIFSKKNHLPNNAMYITFSILFKKIQDLINDLGRKHLDFYYQTVLQQTPSKGIPTQTVVCFELSPKSKGALIPEKTTLIAGKLFDSKKNVLFETIKPLLAVPVEIPTIQNFYLSKSPFIKIGTNKPIISNIIRNSIVANGKPNKTKVYGLFGADENTIIGSEVSKSNGTDIGFIIGSQVLFLEEGEREITITFELEAASADNSFWKLLREMATNRGLPLDVVFNSVFEEAFLISYTTKDKWKTVDGYYIQFDEALNTFSIGIRLATTMPSVTISSTEKQYSWPMIKILLSEVSPIYVYSFFKSLKLERLTIDVAVSGIKNLSVYNNNGKVSLVKPFHLFGNSPKLGSNLLVGKSELYQKELTDINLQIEWESVPNNYGGFETYYKEYSEKFYNSSFKIDAAALSDGYWFPREERKREQFSLFTTYPTRTPEGYASEKLAKKTTIQLTNLDQYRLTRDYKLKDPIPYTINSNNGFFKFTLIAPENVFGQDLYRKDYAEIATNNARNNESQPLPNPPFVPTVKELTLDYTAKDVIYFNNAFDGNTDTLKGDFIHITPFGLERTVIDSKVYKDTIVCDLEGEGYLYVKLKNVESESTISLFFDLMNNIPSFFEEEHEVRVEYKNADRWLRLPAKNLVSDGTNQLTKSGIIEVLLPAINSNDKIKELEIRFVATHNAYKYPTLKGIYPNAIMASCISTEDIVVGKKVPAESIVKLGKKIPEIKAVVQPQHSYGGKIPTKPELFYTEVSERLRHKDRAVTIWDYEHLILQYFHEVTAVKCTNLNQHFKQQPGKLTLVVLSQKWKYDKHHYFNANELNVIAQFVKSKANSFIKIKVQNPTIEWLLVTCIVEFELEDQGGYYIQELNEELNQYLCPVSHNQETNVEGIGGTVVPRMLKSHLENLPYIQNIKKLEIEHVVKKGLDDFSLKIYKENQEIKPTKPWSMLVPKLKHNIYVSSILEEETIEEIESQNFRIGIDYIIAGDDEYIYEEEQVKPKENLTEETEDKINTQEEQKSNSILSFKIK
ncbi:hypothetical protein [uncultured Tenacibaculum sp.]|uniref:hypothetical protein n=1 Tax=uncultured Tenacibaculum sp. TaxID=174713 RepID=UPI002627B461|nr:hypothetical protein [uncultured Tenacibaculum sp.]